MASDSLKNDRDSESDFAILAEIEKRIKGIEEDKRLFLKQYADRNWGQEELDALKAQNLAGSLDYRAKREKQEKQRIIKKSNQQYLAFVARKED